MRKTSIALAFGLLSGGCLATNPHDTGTPVTYAVVASCSTGCPWGASGGDLDLYTTTSQDAARYRLRSDGEAWSLAHRNTLSIPAQLSDEAAQWRGNAASDMDLEWTADDGARLHILVYTVYAIQ